LGVLLKYAFGHVEALQIVDVPEFILHIKECLVDVEQSEKKELDDDEDKLQDTLVIHYLSSVGLKMEDMDEDRVMDLIETNNVFSLFVDHMNKHYMWYKLDTLEASAVFLSHAMASDAFKTEPTRFVTDDNFKKKIVNLKGLYIHHLLAGTIEKREILELMDNLDVYEKAVGPCTITPWNPPAENKK